MGRKQRRRNLRTVSSVLILLPRISLAVLAFNPHLILSVVIKGDAEWYCFSETLIFS